jgi:hypothetical protein
MSLVSYTEVDITNKSVPLKRAAHPWRNGAPTLAAVARGLQRDVRLDRPDSGPQGYMLHYIVCLVGHRYSPAFISQVYQPPSILFPNIPTRLILLFSVFLFIWQRCASHLSLSAYTCSIYYSSLDCPSTISLVPCGVAVWEAARQGCHIYALIRSLIS